MLHRSAVAALRILALAGALVAAAACAGGRPVPEPPRDLHQVPPDAWPRLAALRIVFGHQSVGANILAGLADVARDFPPAALLIVQGGPEDTAEPGLVHFLAGRNGVPTEKVDHFARFVDSSPGGGPDVAFLKFCYIDAGRGTDVRALFNHYRSAMAALQARHPRTTLVHLTMPVRAVQTGWKVPVKRLLGREPGGYADNIAREEYNALLRAEYRGKAPLFDLAAIESTRADGRRFTFEADGRTFFSLAPEYSRDGGHLNELGRRIVAEQLLLMLADIASSGR